MQVKEALAVKRVVFPVHVHVKRALAVMRGLCFRSCIFTCEKSIWNEESVLFPVHVHVKEALAVKRVVFPVHVHVKGALAMKRGLCFRFRYM